MFNILSSNPKLFFLTLFSFIIFFTIRQLFIKKYKFVFLYHICLFGILFIVAIGGGGVQNAGYYSLEKFIALEKNNQLAKAKKNVQNYDSMFQADLLQFESSKELRDYLKKYDVQVDQEEAIFIGWLFALFAEISISLIQIFGYIFRKNSNKI
jgi:hypothetical protein